MGPERGPQPAPPLSLHTILETKCKAYAMCVHTGYRWQLVRSSDKATSQQFPARSTSAQDITALSDRGSDGSLEGAPSLHSRPHLGTAGEVERLRSTLRQKEDQVASLQSQLINLEATRDRSACYVHWPCPSIWQMTAITACKITAEVCRLVCMMIYLALRSCAPISAFGQVSS